MMGIAIAGSVTAEGGGRGGQQGNNDRFSA